MFFILTTTKTIISRFSEFALSGEKVKESKAKKIKMRVVIHGERG